MTILGVSTSVLCDRRQLDTLLAYEPQVVEFYNYPTSMLATLQRFCERNGIRPALHTPVPYDDAEALRRFAPTGPDRHEAAAAIRLVAGTIRYAAHIDALHVVVHFPSPYPPYRRTGFTASCVAFLNRLVDLSVDHGVTVLIENLSAHPLLRTAQQYKDMLVDRPELGFCLDVGHAHLVGGEDHPLSYAEALGNAIRSLHVYNTTRERYPAYGHELANRMQSADDGYLDLPLLLPELLRKSRPAVLVLEHSHSNVNARTVAQSAAWIRELIERHNGREARD